MKANEEPQLFWNDVPVLTTMMLSERLGIAEANIRKNYSKNKERFKIDDDYFEIKGTDLKTLRAELHNLKLDRYQIDTKTPFLYLWTEGGAHNHAKIGQTDESWEAFLHLKSTYFRQREALRAIKEFHESNSLFPHTKRPIQIENSKLANKINYESGGKGKVVEYNLNLCLLITGKTPKQLKEKAKEFGLKAKQMTSGKEVCRHLFPVEAAAMSLTDDFCNHGGDLKEMAQLSNSVKPVFAKMIELGMIQKAS